MSMSWRCACLQKITVYNNIQGYVFVFLKELLQRHEPHQRLCSLNTFVPAFVPSTLIFFECPSRITPGETIFLSVQSSFPVELNTHQTEKEDFPNVQLLSRLNSKPISFNKLFHLLFNCRKVPRCQLSKGFCARSVTLCQTWRIKSLQYYYH